MSALLGRRWRVEVDGLRLEGFRTAFKVRRTTGAVLNTAEITLSNLALDTRAQLGRTGARVSLTAGYEGTAALLFSGEIRPPLEVRKAGTEVEVLIRAADGDGAYRSALYSGTFGPGALVLDVVAAVARALGVGSEDALRRLRAGGHPVAQALLPRGHAASGRASTVLSVLLAPHGLGWSIQDGELQVLATREVLPGEALLLEPPFLVGVPEVATKKSESGGPTSTGTKLTTLLHPPIRPGVQLLVRSRGVRGYFRANTVEHVGDTHGAAWHTQIEATPL